MNNSDIVTHVNLNCTIKHMAGRWWGARFSTVGVGAYRQGKEARMSHVVVDSSWDISLN